LTPLDARADATHNHMDTLKAKIRHVPDFPKPGILFYDITTLLNDAQGFRDTVEAIAGPYRDKGIEQVVGIESRGFILGAAVANALGAGFVPIRKPGKLPSKCHREEYALEYGTDSLEIHEDAVGRGQRVLVVDDVLATGGTAKAAAGLVRKVGGDIVGLSFLIELNFLNGRSKLTGEEVYSVLQY
jgi:adenine phosphoribosyltransferase